MGRSFDNNIANYMSRASVNLGLNGSTECSVAFWFNPPSFPSETRIFTKDHGAAWPTLDIYLHITTGIVQFEVGNVDTNAFANWEPVTGLSVDTWTRMLFTWKRNALDATDGLIYINGSTVSTAHASLGYIGSFTIKEESSTLFYGQRPALDLALSGKLAWVTVWNRQLTAGEATTDATNPLGVTSGLVSRVQLCPDTDAILLGSMTVNGTCPCESEVPSSGRIRELAALGWNLPVGGKHG
jgi:hypothetical protein